MILRGSRKPIIFGTRGSPLALVQTEEAKSRLQRLCRCDSAELKVRVIRTAGDRSQSLPISEIGGKNVFCREIEQALIKGEIDIAVHSMKDLPIAQPDGCAADCVLPRADPRDALICRDFRRIEDLPEGSVVGTSSLRRRAQLLNRNPKLKAVGIRGNVETRLRKLENGEVDATLLAMAGLRRLGRDGECAFPISVKAMLPAAAQGAICLERRADDTRVAELLSKINDRSSALRTTAERAVLAGLGGDCTTPIGVFAELKRGIMTLCGELLTADGRKSFKCEIEGPEEDAAELGLELSRRILAQTGGASRSCRSG